jgi:hypothetical protein
LVALALTLLAISAAAQAPGVAAPPGGLIISEAAADHVMLHGLLRRVVSKTKCEEPASTRSKIWTATQRAFDRLKQQLVALGIRFALLREDWNHILKRNTTPLSTAEEETVAKGRRSGETVGITLMRAPEAAVAEYALTGGAEDQTSRLVVPLSDNRQVTLVRNSAARTDRGVIWRGMVEDTGESAVLLWWRDGRLTGVLGYHGHIYTVMNVGGDLHALLEANPEMMPPDHPPIGAEPRPGDVSAPLGAETAIPEIAPLTAADLQALQAKAVVINVMMLYTRRAAEHYMRSPADVLELAIERVNETFRNSGIGNVRLRLVHTAPVDYDEQGAEEFIDLYRMVDGDGPFKDVRRLRDERRAAIVGLVVDDPSGCGLSTRVAADAEEAYFVVHHACAAITISIAHEIGHILGARHDRQSDPTNWPFPYGHGYINGKWRDIMSLPEGCSGCLRIPFWSNPRVLYQDEPTGTLNEDNARVILEQAERVSHFR